MGNNRGYTRPGGGLSLFATKATTHTAHFYGHGMKRNIEHLRHQLLGFAGVLVGGMDDNALILGGVNHAGLAFQIEVLLATDE